MEKITFHPNTLALALAPDPADPLTLTLTVTTLTQLTTSKATLQKIHGEKKESSKPSKSQDSLTLSTDRRRFFTQMYKRPSCPHTNAASALSLR